MKETTVNFGPVRQSPSKLQRLLYEAHPRWSTPVFTLLAIAPPIVILHVMLHGSVPIQGFVAIWISFFLAGWPIAYWTRPDRNYSTEERLDQVMPYWPHPHVPSLTKRTHILGAATAVAINAWLVLLNVRHLLQEGVERPAVVYALMLTGGTIFFIAMIWRSVVAEPSPEAIDEEKEDAPSAH